MTLKFLICSKETGQFAVKATPFQYIHNRPIHNNLKAFEYSICVYYNNVVEKKDFLNFIVGKAININEINFSPNLISRK